MQKKIKMDGKKKNKKKYMIIMKVMTFNKSKTKQNLKKKKIF